jgi:hypothetical protein
MLKLGFCPMLVLKELLALVRLVTASLRPALGSGQFGRILELHAAGHIFVTRGHRSSGLVLLR